MKWYSANGERVHSEHRLNTGMNRRGRVSFLVNLHRIAKNITFFPPSLFFAFFLLLPLLLCSLLSVSTFHPHSHLSRFPSSSSSSSSSLSQVSSLFFVHYTHAYTHAQKEQKLLLAPPSLIFLLSFADYIFFP